MFLSGFQFVLKSRPLPDEDTNVVFAQPIQFDSCTGKNPNTSGLVADAFQARGLNAASMEAAIPLSTGTWWSMSVAAVGPRIKTRSKSRTEFKPPRAT